MDSEASKQPAVSWRKLSLKAVLILVTCICCYLGGHNAGYQEAMQLWNGMPLIPRSYSARELVGSVQDDPNKFESLEDLALDLKQNVLPRTWVERGGAGKVIVYEQTGMLVVSANTLVHQRVGDYLEGNRERIRVRQTK